MTDEQIEPAFNEAQAQWIAERPGVGYATDSQRYFFFVGSEFGLALAKEIYSETLGNVGKLIDDHALIRKDN